MKVKIFMKTGKISGNVLRRSILQQIRTKRREVVSGAGLGEDCAIFAFEEVGKNDCGDKNDSCVTDGCVIISCVQEGILPVEAVLQRCVNIIAARGAGTAAVAMSILLPPDAEEKALKEIMAEAEHFCAQYDIQIAQAQGRVTAAVREPFVTVTAYGRAVPGRGDKAAAARDAADRAVSGRGDKAVAAMSDIAYHTVKAARPGQDIVVSKWIGLEGTAILAARYQDSLLERYPAWFIEEAAGFGSYLSTIPEAAVAVKSGVCAMQNVSEGGILTSLWELAEGAGVGLTIDLKKLPIRQETVEICNHCNVNPYELLSGGCLLMTCGDGAGLAAALEQEGIPASVVGRVTDSNDRLILNDGEVRYLDRPQGDSLFRPA